MDASSNRSIILLAILMLLLVQPNSGYTPSKLVQDVCDKLKNSGTNYQHCISALALDPKTATNNLTTLSKLSLQLAITNTTASVNYIEKMLNDKRTKPTLLPTIKSCLDCHKAAKGSFWSALRELKEDIPTASYDVRIAGDDAQLCEDTMVGNKVKIPSISLRSGYILLYSRIGTVVIDRLEASMPPPAA